MFSLALRACISWVDIPEVALSNYTTNTLATHQLTSIE